MVLLNALYVLDTYLSIIDEKDERFLRGNKQYTIKGKVRKT